MKSRLLFRILLISGILIVLVLGALMGILAYRHQKSTRLFKEGQEAFFNEDYETAEAALTRYLGKDPNKEDAWRYLAEINEKRKRWFQAAYFWGHLIRLNPLDDEYVTRCIRANYRIHNYLELSKIFLKLPREKLRDFQDIYILSKFKTEPEEEETRKLIEELPEDNLTARLIHALQTPGPVSELAALEKTDDVVVQVEAFMQDAAIAEWLEKNLERAESCYRQAAELNPTLCRGELGNFLFRHRRYPEAIETYRLMKETMLLTVDVILNYAEALFYQRDKEQLRQLEQFIPRNDRNAISMRAYIHCLLAVLENNIPEMVKNYNVAQQNRKTPIGLLLSYTVAVESNNIPLLVSVLSVWKKTTIFQQKLPEILERVRPLLARTIQDKNWMHAASLAELFLDEQPPEKTVWEAYLLARAASLNLSPNILQEAIRLFPDNPVFRSMALRLATSKGDLPASLAAFDDLIATSDNPLAERYRKVIFLEQNNHIDEAFAELKKLVEADNSLQTLKHCLSFGIRTGKREALEIALREPSLQPIATFEMERRYGDIDKAIDLLQKQPIEQGLDAAKVEDRELLLPIAIYLGLIREHKRAIAAYEALAPYVTQNATIDINLSEIHADLGNKKLSLQYAEKAFKRFPNSQLARTIYGVRCAENGDYEQAARLIPDSVPSQAFKNILVFCLERNVEHTFNNTHYATCRNIIARLKLLQPDNPTAQEYLDKIEQLNAPAKEQPENE